jgi:putative toxin-antitoxin system antitoxin component (TIGR02293 family)
MAELLEDAAGRDVLRILGATRLAGRGRSAGLELRAAVRKGLPFSAFESVSKEVDLSRKQLATALGIPERTIARRKEERHLTLAESDRLYRVARAAARATAVLGSLDKARAWLKQPNRGLGDETPMDLLDTDIGTRQVEDVLLRLEHGIHG